MSRKVSQHVKLRQLGYDSNAFVSQDQESDATVGTNSQRLDS